jgi:hypothetical protein
MVDDNESDIAPIMVGVDRRTAQDLSLSIDNVLLPQTALLVLKQLPSQHLLDVCEQRTSGG